MALSDILTMTAEKVNQVSSYAGGTNSTLKATFLRGINEGYRQLLEKYKPDYSQSVTLDADGCFNPYGSGVLTKTFLSLKRVVNEIDDTWAYTVTVLQNDKWQVSGGTSGQSVLVCYYYKPADLALDADVPVIPDALVGKEAYADYAAYYYFTAKQKFDKAVFFKTLFDNFMTDKSTANRAKKILAKPML